MGRTACTDPQCLYKGALYLFTFTVPFQKQKNTNYGENTWFSNYNAANM